MKQKYQTIKYHSIKKCVFDTYNINALSNKLVLFWFNFQNCPPRGFIFCSRKWFIGISELGCSDCFNRDRSTRIKLTTWLCVIFYVVAYTGYLCNNTTTKYVLNIFLSLFILIKIVYNKEHERYNRFKLNFSFNSFFSTQRYFYKFFPNYL